MLAVSRITYTCTPDKDEHTRMCTSVHQECHTHVYQIIKINRLEYVH